MLPSIQHSARGRHRAAPVACGLGALLAVLAAGYASSARADEMDVSLARLKVPTGPDTCARDSDGDGNPDRIWCPDNANWKRLSSQLGMSMAPPVLSPARTIGPGGFHVAFESWMTGIDSGARYWQQGTEGDADGTSEICRGAPEGMDLDGNRARVRGCNRFVKNNLYWSRFAIRKGFPFGFELDMSAGHAWNTSYWTWGLGLKWSLFEGFRKDAWGFLPDVAVRGMVQTLTGEQEFNLTVPSVDLTISKPLVVMDTVTFTPFASGQMLWIIADSELVDLTPGTDEVGECVPEPGPPREGDASAIRCRGNASDFNNNAVFDQMRALRWRLALGLELRYELLVLKGSFMFDIVKPGDADSEVDFDDGGPQLPRQWTIALGAGLQL